MMRNTKTSSILFDNIHSENLIHGAGEAESERGNYMVENRFSNSTKKRVHADHGSEERLDSFQLDFFYFHLLFGIFHIEVKRVSSKRCLLRETKQSAGN